MKKHLGFLAILCWLLCSPLCYGQNDSLGQSFKKNFVNTANNFSLGKSNTWNGFLTPSKTLNKARIWTSVGSFAAGYGATLVVLYDVWYKDGLNAKFNFYNDWDSWLHIDKFGHAYTAYQETMAGIELMKWTGIKRNKAIIYGGLTGTICQSMLEFFDGFTENYGFSVGDLGANTLGSVLAIGQELAWGQQRVHFKFSSHKNEYPDVPIGPGYSLTVKRHAEIVYGTNFIQRYLKDYDSQAYWVSFNPERVFSKDGETRFMPKWLCFSVGYGANDFLYLDSYKAPYGQYYLSLDLDLTTIKTRSRTLRVLFNTINCLKFPAPTLEFNKGSGKMKGYWHWLYM